MSKYMFEHFCSYENVNPNEVADYYKCDPYALHVRLKNGECYYYDELDQTSRILPPDSGCMTERQIKHEFANRLRRIMWVKDITQMELSEGTGITQTMISKYLNQSAVPSFVNVVKIVKFIGCSLDDLTYND